MACAPSTQPVTGEQAEEESGNRVSAVSSLSPWNLPVLRSRATPSGIFPGELVPSPPPRPKSRDRGQRPVPFTPPPPHPHLPHTPHLLTKTQWERIGGFEPRDSLGLSKSANSLCRAEHGGPDSPEGVVGENQRGSWAPWVGGCRVEESGVSEERRMSPRVGKRCPSRPG